jgi:hypothetical protein
LLFEQLPKAPSGAACPLSSGERVVFDSGEVLTVSMAPACQHTIRRRITAKSGHIVDDYLALDKPGPAGAPSEGLLWFAPHHRPNQQFFAVPLSEGGQGSESQRAAFFAGDKYLLLNGEKPCCALSQNGDRLCMIPFQSSVPLSAQALWEVEQSSDAGVSFTCQGRRFSGDMHAHLRGGGLSGTSPVTLSDELEKPMRPAPIALSGDGSAVFLGDRRKTARLWSFLKDGVAAACSKEEAFARSLLTAAPPLPGLVFPSSSLLATHFDPVLPVLVIRKVEGAADLSLPQIMTHCLSIVRFIFACAVALAPLLTLQPPHFFFFSLISWKGFRSLQGILA